MSEKNNGVTLSERASGQVEAFLSTLKKNYVYPKYVISSTIERGLELSGSEIRDIVRSLRRDYVLVISDTKGYSYTDDWKVMEDVCLPHLRGRRNSIDTTIREIEKAIYQNKHKKANLNQFELL